MGCDIHLYIEFKERDSWLPFGSRINPGRIYGMFAKLADVRNSYGIVPISQPRGLPADFTHSAFLDYTMYVSDDEGDRHASKEQAERWIASGSSKYMDEHQHFISGPDWHSESWCTAAELETAIKEIWEGRMNGCEVEWNVVLDAMKSFERQGREVRAVFWFDN